MASKRISHPGLMQRAMSAEDAAALLTHGMTVGMSGFTGSGYPKAVPMALAARIQAEHAAGVGGVPGLAQQLAVDHHHRVRRQHQLSRRGLGRRLLAGEADDGLLRRLAGSGRFVQIHGADGEAQAEAGQQLAAPRRAGGEDESGEAQG